MLRRAARLLVVDSSTRTVLLFQYEDDGRTWWATPGGGLETEETFEQAAIREASEELAIVDPSLSPLWQRTVAFTFRGIPIVQQEQYFLIRTSRDECLTGSDVVAAHAREGIVAVRWWSREEIDKTSEPIFPEDLSNRLRDLERD